MVVTAVIKPGTLLVDADVRKDGVLVEGLEVFEFFEEVVVVVVVVVGLVGICDPPGFFDWATGGVGPPPWLLLWWL